MLNIANVSSKPLKLTLSGLKLMFLTILLTSCVTIQAPSRDYLADCPIPYLKDGPAKNKDIVILAVKREYAIKSCNLDKKAIRDWYEAQCRGAFKRCEHERR